MRLDRRMLLYLIAVLLPLTGHANTPVPDDPFKALDAMSRSFRELDYHGLFTYEHGQQLSSLRISHALHGGGERETVVRLDGDELAFSNHQHGPDCVHPGARLLRGDLSAGDQGLAQFYDVRRVGEERVAGHRGIQFRVTPKDRFRFGYLLVLDAASSLLLKSEVHDDAGRLIERFQFAELEIGRAANDLAGGTATAGYEMSHVDESREAAGERLWQVGWVPPGFMGSGGVADVEGTDGALVQSQVYSDGLAVFSIFVEPATGADKEPGRAAQGATVAYSIPRGPGYLVTVIGEIPPDTAQLVANSVNFPVTR